jgi:hypothetical protein
MAYGGPSETDFGTFALLTSELQDIRFANTSWVLGLTNLQIKNTERSDILGVLYLEGHLGLEPRTPGLKGLCSNQLS